MSITLFEYWSQHHEEVGACSLHVARGLVVAAILCEEAC